MCGLEFFGTGKCCCEDHSMRRVRESVTQLKEKKGPIYDKWKSNLKKSLKRV